MTSVFITGGSGEIGGALVERLARAGHGLAILSRRPPVPDPRHRWVAGDLRERAGLEAAIGDAEVVVHCAAVTHTNSDALYEEVNVRGTENLLAAARAAGARRFVHLGTRAVGEAGGGYSRSKLLAERAVEASGLAWVILRPAEVYGGGGRDAVMELVDTVRRRRIVPVLGDGSCRLSPVHVDDVVEAVARSVDGAGREGATYTLAGPEEMTMHELLDRIEAVLGVPRRIRLRVPVALARAAIACAALLGRGGLVRDQIPRLLLPKSADSSLAARDLGYSPRSLERGLADLLAAT